MIEEYLLNYGVLGLWTATLLWERFNFQKQIKSVIERNTSALTKIDKRLKDLQQAICTSVIVDRERIQTLFESLPKKWRQAIVKMLVKAPEELPLLREEIEKLKLTLQSNKE